MFLDAGADPSLFLHAPGEVLKVEGVDGLSRAGAKELRASEATQLLRSPVDDEACRHGERITLDVLRPEITQLYLASLHGTRSQLQRARTLSLDPVGRYLCPACGRRHREFPLISSSGPCSMRRRGRDVVIAPYALSDSAWPLLMGASITRVANQWDACHIIPASATQRYVSDTSELGGASAWRSSRWTSGGSGPVPFPSQT